MQKDIALLLLRLAFGGFMIYGHGWRKMMKLFTGDPTEFADPLGVGAPISLSLTVFSEVLCAALIVVGLFTRWASVPLAFTMLVAAFVVHGADPFGDKESALIYFAAFAAIGLMGAGKFSIDGLIGKK